MLTLREMAESLSLAPNTLRMQIKLGKVNARKLGRDWYVTPEEVERYRREHLRERAA